MGKREIRRRRTAGFIGYVSTGERKATADILLQDKNEKRALEMEEKREVTSLFAWPAQWGCS